MMVVTASVTAKKEGTTTRDFDSDNIRSDMDTQDEEVGIMDQKPNVSAVAFTRSYLSMNDERLNNDDKRKTPPQTSCEEQVLREITGQFAKLSAGAAKRERMIEGKRTVGGERTAAPQRSVRVCLNN